MLKSHPDNFKLDYALSREAKNKDGGKMYIQDKVAEYSDEVFTRMDNVRPPHITYTQGCSMRAWGYSLLCVTLHGAFMPHAQRAPSRMRASVPASIALSHRGRPSHRDRPSHRAHGLTLAPTHRARTCTSAASRA